MSCMKIFRSIVLVLSFSIAFTANSRAVILPAPPKVDATSYLVMDYQSGRIIVRHNIDKRVEPASLTKMMTVYIVAGEIASGNIHLNDMVPISEKAWRMPGSRMFVEVGDKVPVSKLLRGVVVQSGNDATPRSSPSCRRHRIGTLRAD